MLRFINLSFLASSFSLAKTRIPVYVHPRDEEDSTFLLSDPFLQKFIDARESGSRAEEEEEDTDSVVFFTNVFAPHEYGEGNGTTRGSLG